MSQKPDYLVENLRGMCAFPTPYGRCDQSRELRDFCTACLAATEIERLRALASASASPHAESDKLKTLRERCQMHIFTVIEPNPLTVKAIVRELLAEVERLASSSTQAVIAAARCIHHWHDALNGDGMVVSASHVRELWQALSDYDSARPAFLEEPQ